MTAILALLDLVPRWLLAAAIAALSALVVVDYVRIAAIQVELAGAATDLADSRTEVASLNTAIAQAATRAALQAAVLSQAVLKAQNDAKIREAGLRSAADAAAAESGGLRDDLAAMRGKYDQLSRDALIERDLAVGAVLTECTARYQGMASKAERHASDVRTLVDAWPKSPAPDLKR